MALPQPKTFRQELPPPGGFPAVKYKKHLVQRGPSSLIIMLGSLGITCGGLWYAMKDNEERECVNCARFPPVRVSLPAVLCESLTDTRISRGLTSATSARSCCRRRRRFSTLAAHFSRTPRPTVFTRPSFLCFRWQRRHKQLLDEERKLMQVRARGR